MKCLGRNKQTLYYALYKGQQITYDEYGNETGQPLREYYDPVEIRMNISAARGTADVEQFGINTVYSKTLVTDDMSCPIDENSILWLGTSTTNPYNYVVKQVAKSLNSITIAIEEVKVNA